MALEPIVPPHDLEAEAAVLSAVMVDPAAYEKVTPWVNHEKFYSEAHRRMFEACEALAAESKPVDVVQVASRLKENGRIEQAGGMTYLTDILNACPVLDNAEEYAKIVNDRWKKRELLAEGQRIVARTYAAGNESAESLVEKAEAGIHIVAGYTGAKKSRLESIKEATIRAFEQVKANALIPDGVTGIASGIADYDKITHGWQRKEVHVIAARPGMGKTALFANAVTSAARLHGACIFSLEMPSEKIALRIICSESGVNVANTISGKLTKSDWPKLTASAADVCRSMSFYIDDQPGLTIPEARARVRRVQALCAQKGVRLGIVGFDYLQLMKATGRHGNREGEVAELSGGMTTIAKEFDVAVIVLSQLNRSLESRADKRPTLADLRESGAIEQDASTITFIYRDYVYNPGADPEVAELIIAKNRNGPTGTVKVGWSGSSTKFYDLPVHHPAVSGRPSVVRAGGQR